MMLLLTLLLATLFFCLAVFRRTTRLGRLAPAAIRQPTVEIHDAALARRALVDYADAFIDRPTILPLPPGRRRSDNLTTVPYGPQWRVLRRNLTGGILHPSRAGLLAPLQRTAVEALVADIAARVGGGDGEVLVREIVRDALFPVAARFCFGDGIGERDVRDLQRVLREFELDVVVEGFGGSMVASLVHWWRLRRFVASSRRQAEVFLPLISRRRRTQHRDDTDGGVFRPYVDSLLDLRVPVGDDDVAGEGKEEHHLSHRALTDDEMVGLVSEFLGGGTESVVSCVEWTLAHLVIEPEIQDKLRREVAAAEADRHGGERGTTPAAYLRAVILESLRMHPPVPLTMRDVRSPQAVEHLSLPDGGARVHFILGDIGRDGKAWTDPDEFRPERFMAGGEAEGVGPLPGPREVRMMPFGAGRRYCPGMGLGVAHACLLVAALVREFEWAPTAVAATGGVDLTEVNGFFKMMRTPLRARATPRGTSA